MLCRRMSNRSGSIRSYLSSRHQRKTGTDHNNSQCRGTKRQPATPKVIHELQQMRQQVTPCRGAHRLTRYAVVKLTQKPGFEICLFNRLHSECCQQCYQLSLGFRN